jgi:hypothetical protein
VTNPESHRDRRREVERRIQKAQAETEHNPLPDR